VSNKWLTSIMDGPLSNRKSFERNLFKNHSAFSVLRMGLWLDCPFRLATFFHPHSKKVFLLMRTKCNFISSMIALFALPYTQEIEGSLGVNFTYILVYNAAFCTKFTLAIFLLFWLILILFSIGNWQKVDRKM
jgi:hypothetical protein